MNCNNQNYTNPEISFYKSWKEVYLYSEEEVQKMSRRTLIKKIKHHDSEESIRGVSDEDLRHTLMEVAVEEREILALGIDGEG